MSLDHFKGSAWSFKELMRLAAADPDLKPAIVKFKKAHPEKVGIGRFAAKVLRMRQGKAR